LTVEEISSPSNPRIKSANSLREPRERRESGLMIIDGESVAQHAFYGGVEIKELFVLQQPDESHRELIAKWQALLQSVRVNVVAKPAMSKLQYGDREESMIAVAVQPSIALESFEERCNAHGSRNRQAKCYLVLDQMEKPGNLGAALRTADASGAAGVLLSDPVSETWNPNAIRSSLGAIFRVPIAVGSSTQIQRWLTEHSVQMVAARVDAGQYYTEFRFNSSTAIIVGNESQGLGSNWQRSDIHSARIPMMGCVDSLNASVSVAIFLYEVVRQHGIAP
jgi:RNA methyltransferase, TrmH family